MKIKCIYCSNELSKESYTKSEHIIPRSFGLFKNNLTLNDIVCDDCNQYYGDNLEIDLARDTYEGILRFKLDIKKPDAYKAFGQNSRMVIRILDGPLKGAYVYREYSPDVNDIILKPLPQIGFRKLNTSDYEYFTIDNIPEKDYLLENGFDIKHPEGICSFGIDDTKTLKKVLIEKNIQSTTVGERMPLDENEELMCEVEGVIDNKIFRAISKIGFNYLAHSGGAELMNHSCFDNARRFIRYGDAPPYKLIRVDGKPILADEPTTGQRRSGHIITVNAAGDGESIVAQVSLFNWAKYSISLARELPKNIKINKSGHFFNIHTQEILKLESR